MRREVFLSVIRRKDHKPYEAKRISLGEQPIHDFNGHEYLTATRYRKLLGQAEGTEKHIVVDGKVVCPPTWEHPDKCFIRRSHDYDAEGRFIPMNERRPNRSFYKNDRITFRGKEWKVKAADFSALSPYITLESSEGEAFNFDIEEFEDDLNINFTRINPNKRPK